MDEKLDQFIHEKNSQQFKDTSFDGNLAQMPEMRILPSTVNNHQASPLQNCNIASVPNNNDDSESIGHSTSASCNSGPKMTNHCDKMSSDNSSVLMDNCDDLFSEVASQENADKENMLRLLKEAGSLELQVNELHEAKDATKSQFMKMLESTDTGNDDGKSDAMALLMLKGGRAKKSVSCNIKQE